METARGGLMAGLAAVALDEVVLLADLQTRVERKYIVEPAVFEAALSPVAEDLRTLEIGTRRHFAYESVYFDTPDLRSYHKAATRRPDRFKIRTRAYLDDGQCTFEVKVRNHRGETVKHQMPYLLAERLALNTAAVRFVAEHLDLAADELSPVLTTRYQRSTIVDGAARVTIDSDLECTDRHGRSIDLPHQWVVETKSSGPATRVDRALWRAGVRPIALSKFAVGMAGTDPTLPAHRWNRVLRRHFAWEPDRAARQYLPTGALGGEPR